MSYPTTLDDSASLPVAADEKVTFLTVAALVGATTFSVNSTTGFPTSGVLETPSGELVAYTGVTATSFTGLTRGYSGTVAQPYPVDTTIKLVLSSDYVNNPRTSLIEVEKKIGIGASNASAATTGDVLKKNGDGTTSWQAETALGYTPEDVANKATDFSVINDTKYPTTKAVDDRFDALIGAAPAALDTLSELSDALADDANFASTVTTALAGKQPLDSDLTAIAALTTTAFGRGLLELANAGALASAANALPLTGGTLSGSLANSGANGATYHYDTSGAAQSIVNNGTVDFSNFSGAIVVNNHNNGHVTLYLCGGGLTSALGSVGAQVGTLAYNAGVGGYRWTNNTGGTATFSFFCVRTRSTA